MSMLVHLIQIEFLYINLSVDSILTIGNLLAETLSQLVGLKGMKVGLILFAMFAVLSACDETGKVGREGSAIWNMRNMSPTSKNEYFAKKCEQYGYERSTDGMRECIADERRNNSKRR